MRNPDKWKIRFGQIFKALLAESGKKLEDYLYFIPEGSMPDIHTEDSFREVDLNVNRSLYGEHFAGSYPSVLPLNSETAKRLNATFVILPGIGHHLIKQRSFAEQIPLLETLGFNVVYAWYDDSFESNKKCAKRVYDILKRNLNDEQSIIFLAYSKGAPIMLEMFKDPRYADITKRTKALVSFAGAIQGAVLPSAKVGQVTVRLLGAYLRYSKKKKYSSMITNWMASLMSWLPFSKFKEWNKLLKQVAEIADDIADLPEGITDLAYAASEENYANLRLPDNIKLFSVSAVFPENELKKGLKFISNPDDLFLYVSGRGAYEHNVFNDTQILLPNSEFFEEMGDITKLGIVKADHWGISLSRALSRKYTDQFPRTEMLNAVLLVLDEYFKERSEIGSA